MRTLLICHDGAFLDQDGLARWLASFSQLVGILVLRERRQRRLRRFRRELERVGAARFLDVLAFRLYYRLFLARKDQGWLNQRLHALAESYPPVPEVPTLYSHSPNTPEAEQFIRGLCPDLMLVRCKTLLHERIFSLPARGSFVMHPGICPEYRNAHGCFWALANGDRERLGMTLLRIDEGVDTGPVYGYYTYRFDEAEESHVVIQYRTVLENLDPLAEKLREIYEGAAVPLDTSGRESAAWGQPWLSRYLKWKRRARRRGR